MERPTLSELQQRAVWENWLGAEIRSHYFADKAAHYERQQKILTWLIVVLSSGAAITVLGKIANEWLGPLLAFATTAMSVFLLVQQHEKRATECRDLYFRWNRLASDFEALTRPIWLRPSTRSG